MLHQLHAKMNRLPAHLTSEDDWKQEQPGVRLSRVFGVVLGIHIVAIGGLMAYEMFRHRDNPPPNTAALRPAVREARPSAGAATQTRVADAFADDPVHDGMLKHVVAPGERLGDIAARYAVDEKALMVKNRLGENRPFQSGMKLVIPNRQLQAAAPVTPAPLATGSPSLSALAPAAPAPVPAEAAADAGDGLVPVARRPYDPSLPTLPAEPVVETTASKQEASRTAGPAKPSARPSAAKTPSAVAATPKKPAAPNKKAETAAAKPKAKGRVHVVKDGDTAYRIAKAYGVNVDQLVKTNGINPNALRPGTPLTIPPAR
jgi:LysM repeat protein